MTEPEAASLARYRDRALYAVQVFGRWMMDLTKPHHVATRWRNFRYHVGAVLYVWSYETRGTAAPPQARTSTDD
jgi:hypothetical protein